MEVGASRAGALDEMSVLIDSIVGGVLMVIVLKVSTADRASS
jgi:hypothetical protein